MSLPDDSDRAIGRGVPPVCDWKHNIGGRVRTARVDAGLSREQLAQAIAREPRRIAKLENNDDIPTVVELHRICIVCKVSREFVWGYDDA